MARPRGREADTKVEAQAPAEEPAVEKTDEPAPAPDLAAQLAKLQAKVDALEATPKTAESTERALLPADLVEPPPVRHGSAPMTAFRHYESARYKCILYAGRDAAVDGASGYKIRGAGVRIAQFEGFLWRTDDEWELKTFREKCAQELKDGTIKEVGTILKEQRDRAEATLKALTARLENPDAPITPSLADATTAAVDAAHKGSFGLQLDDANFTPRAGLEGVGPDKPQPPAVREKQMAPSNEPEINTRFTRPGVGSGTAEVR